MSAVLELTDVSRIHGHGQTLDQPTGGTVAVEGTDLATVGNTGRARLRRTSIGYVFQDFNLIPALTACENVALTALAVGLTTRSRLPMVARID